MSAPVHISNPVLGPDGRWHAYATIAVGDDVIVLHATAPRDIASRALRGASRFVNVRPYESFEESPAAFGCGPGSPPGVKACGCASSPYAAPEMQRYGFGEDEAAGFFDNVMNVVGKVANNPIVKAAASVIPYGGLVVGAASAASGIYSAVKAGSPQAKAKVKKIRAAARAGNPKAREAYAKLQSVAQADHLRKQVKAGNPKALRRLQQIAAAVHQDPAALEAAAMVKSLELADTGVPPAPPPQFDLPLDAGEGYADELAGEIARQVERRQSLSPQHRAILDHLNAIRGASPERSFRW